MTEQEITMWVWVYLVSLPGMLVYNSFVLYNVYTGKWKTSTDLMAGVCLSLLPLVGTFFAVGAVVQTLLKYVETKGTAKRLAIRKAGWQAEYAKENKHGN